MEHKMQSMNIKVSLCRLLGLVNCLAITDLLKEKGDDRKLRGFTLFTSIVLLLLTTVDLIDVMESK